MNRFFYDLFLFYMFVWKVRRGSWWFNLMLFNQRPCVQTSKFFHLTWSQESQLSHNVKSLTRIGPATLFLLNNTQFLSTSKQYKDHKIHTNALSHTISKWHGNKWGIDKTYRFLLNKPMLKIDCMVVNWIMFFFERQKHSCWRFVFDYYGKHRFMKRKWIYLLCYFVLSFCSRFLFLKYLLRVT